MRSGGGGLGFVKDLRRLNVALTRARHALYIVGHEASLRRSADWHALLTNARERGWSRDVTLDAASRQPPHELLPALVPLSLLDGSRLPTAVPAAASEGQDGPAAWASQPRRAVFLQR